MNFLDKMERKFGRYAIKNLPAVMIGLYAAGYVLGLVMPDLISYLTLEPYYILHGQIWRIVTWLLIPPSSLDVFTIIMLLFYFSIGRTLERTWGTFRFNFYIFSGIIFTVIGSLLLYGGLQIAGYVPVVQNATHTVLMLRGQSGYILGNWFSTYYINMSIFLAFALTYPDMQVLLYFIIPIRMKWLGILYGVLLAYNFMEYPWPGRAAILASLLNFIVFFLFTRRSRLNPQQMKRRRDFKKAFHSSGNPDAFSARNSSRYAQSSAAGRKSGQPMHRCAVCGRTELDNPGLEFRYCSKCYGNYEYCQDHLFNHKHVPKPGTENDPQ